MPSIISGGQLADLSRPGSREGSAVTVVDPGVPLSEWTSGGVDPDTIWKSQPSVRKVVDYIARAVASTPWKLYRRVSDTDRARVTDHPLARTLGAPSPGVIPFRLWHSVIVDYLTYDRMVVLKAASRQANRKVDLVRLQAQRVRFESDGLGRVAKIHVGATEIAPDLCLFDHGYSPLGANGTTPMETLGEILQEGREAVEYRRGVWRNGARVPAVIERPADAPAWSAGAKQQFAAGWAAYARGGKNVGGTPILEDGMKLAKSEAFTPKDTLDIEGRRLTDVEVAAAFHIAPELVGAREGNYSNVQAFRQMLYRDGLGPLFVTLEQIVNAMLVAEHDPAGELYAEMDIDAKLRGSFEEQAQYGQSAVGAPYMTRNEYRARLNLPALPGGDELIVPLNVLEGGQASPRDTAPKAARKFRRRRKVKAPDVEPLRISAKAAAEQAQGDGEPFEDQTAAVLSAYFRRQRAAVLSAIGAEKAGRPARVKAAGDPGWWDAERWDRELADDLHTLALSVTGEIGESVAEQLGFDADAYDPGHTVNFLRAVAESRAGMINSTTRDQIRDVLAAAEDLDPDTDPDEIATPADVFDEAEGERSLLSAVTLVTTLAAFATTEAATQTSGDNATKTWVVTSGKPRLEHAQMDGETVPISDVFSNGANWPGDPILGADGVAGCTCDVVVEQS